MLLLRTLSLVGGLPVRSDSNGQPRLVADTAWLVVAVIYTLFMANVAFVVEIVFSVAGWFTFNDAVNALFAMGLSITNVASIFGVMTINNLLLFPLLFSIYVHRVGIVEVYYKSEAMAATYLGTNEVDRIKTAEDRSTLLQMILVCFTSVLMYWPMSGLASFRPGVPEWVKVALGVTFVIMLATHIMSAINASVTNVLMKTLKLIIAGLSTWTNKANNSFEALKERAIEAKTITQVTPSDVPDKLISAKDICAMVSDGEQVLSIIREFNRTYGSLLFFNTAKMLLSGTCSLLFTCSSYVLATQPNPETETMTALFVAHFACLLILNTAKSFSITYLGQVFAVSCSDEILRLRLDQLVDNLSTSRGVCPLNCFSLGSASYLSIVGLLLTYFFMLFQMSIAEGQAACGSVNATVHNS